MTRFMLIVASLALAAHDLTRPTSLEVASVTGRILVSLAYAFTPAAIGLVAAGLKRLMDKWVGSPGTFNRDWNWIWGVLLALLIAAHIYAGQKA